MLSQAAISKSFNPQPQKLNLSSTTWFSNSKQAEQHQQVNYSSWRWIALHVWFGWQTSKNVCLGGEVRM
jgi:hypothetical protein